MDSKKIQMYIAHIYNAQQGGTWPNKKETEQVRMLCLVERIPRKEDMTQNYSETNCSLNCYFLRGVILNNLLHL